MKRYKIIFTLLCFAVFLPTELFAKSFLSVCEITENKCTSSMGAHVVDVEEIDRRVNNFASLVGEEQFNLVVGGTLLVQSAFYGQKEHGEKVSAPRNEVPVASTASEHIEAGLIQHEIVPEEHSFEDESFNIPLGDLISLVSTLTPKEELARAVADDMKAQGKSNQEAMEAAQETKAIVVVSEAARRKVATRKKAAVAKVRHALIEKALEVAAQSFRMDDDAFIAFVEQYACEHPNDSIAREWSIASMILAQEQRAIYLEAARQFEALPLSEKAKRYAEVARDAALEYANEFSADPLAHTKDLASGLGYFALDMAVPGGIDPAVQWWNGEMSGNQAAALWGVCAGIDISGGYLIEKGGKALKTIGKAAVRGGEKLTTRIVEKIACEKIAKKRTVGQVGRYGDLTSGVLKDGLQAHHIPSDAFMHRYSIARNDGLAVILTKEQHKATRTYGAKNKRILSNANSTARSELAADIWDVRNILRREGLYNKEVNRNLMKGMTDFRQKYPEIFKKVKK